MNRMPCTIALMLGVTALVGLQTANATLLTKDSADFKYKYEMNVDPAWQDLPGTPAGYDFAKTLSGVPLVLPDGTTVLEIGPADGYYYSTPATLPGALMGSSDITYANGWTLELRMKAADYSGFDYSIGLEVGSQSPDSALLFFGDNGILWHGTSDVSIDTPANDDGFHVFRIAHLQNQNVYELWRDGVRLASQSTLTGRFDDGVNMYLGMLSEATAGAVLIDYLRMTPGAYAVPEPTSVTLLLIGLIGLLAYAWWKGR